MVREEIDRLTEYSATKISQRLLNISAEKVKECFCPEKCSQICDNPCPEAQELVYRFAGLLWQSYVKTN